MCQANEADENGHDYVDEFGFEEGSAALGKQWERGVAILADTAGQKDGQGNYTGGVK